MGALDDTRFLSHLGEVDWEESPPNRPSSGVTRTLFIDFDSWIIKAAHSNEMIEGFRTVSKFIPPSLTELCALQHAVISKTLVRLQEEVVRWQASEYTTQVFLFLTEPDPKGQYHRHSIYPEYKHNRKPKSDFDVWFRGFITTMKHAWASQLHSSPYRVLVFPGYEADDLIGLAVGLVNLYGDEAVILTADKDLLTIPDACIFRETDQQLVRTTQASADQMVRYQMVVGDVSDGYPGLKGYGAKAWLEGKQTKSGKGDHPPLLNLTPTAFKEWYISVSSTTHYNTMKDMAEMLRVPISGKVPHRHRLVWDYLLNQVGTPLDYDLYDLLRGNNDNAPQT